MRSQISRRIALKSVVGAAATTAWPMAALSQGKEIRIGVTLDLSGSQMQKGLALQQGSLAFFNALNRRGGVNGKRVELTFSDDKFDAEAAKRNAREFASDSATSAILHPYGTRQTLGVLEGAGDLPVVGPFTGTDSLRKLNFPNTFWVRASYSREVDRLVAHATTLGYTRLGLVYPKDQAGEAVLAAFNGACAAKNIKPAVLTTTPGTASLEIESAVQDIGKAAPQIVLLALIGEPAVRFVSALRKAGNASTVWGLSIALSPEFTARLGAQARGLGFAIVVPSPFNSKYDIVRLYRSDMAASGFESLTLESMESYIDAAVLAEGLRRSGGSQSRAAISSALEQLVDLDLGGFDVRYGKGVREGSQFVDIAVLGNDGRLLS